jgi:hypothetical protein
MPQGGSRKGETFGAWFSELAKKELCFTQLILEHSNNGKLI